jgi:signal transduction histidine kinase
MRTLAQKNARLQAALLAQLHEVEQSRARIVEATLAERRRIEQDLHDGAQQRLLALAATIGRLATRNNSAADRRIVDQAGQETRLAIRELRDLAHGIHPAQLTEGGLRPAIRSVTDRLPVHVELDVPDRRWPPRTEATAYFVICEALTNAAKHACCERAEIRVLDHADLRLAVFDNGTGGADLHQGTGLRGISDRVAALGGKLTLTSPRGGGTRIEVTLPCE